MASSRFEHHPLADYAEEHAVHLYVDQLNEPRTGGGGSGSVAKFLRALGDRTHQRVMNETQSPDDLEFNWRYHGSSHYRELKDYPSRLDTLLEIVSRQTSLQFRKEKRMVEVWLARDLEEEETDR